jgi:hypothetical protein
MQAEMKSARAWVRFVEGGGDYPWRVTVRFYENGYGEGLEVDKMEATHGSLGDAVVFVTNCVQGRKLRLAKIDIRTARAYEVEGK